MDSGVTRKMPLFTGTYENKVDGKGRVSLPAPFRDRLSQAAGGAGSERSFYIFPSPNSPGLEAADESFMDMVAESIEAQAELFSEEEEALSQIVADALPVSYDSTGRFILPPRFQSHAAIGGKALFVGKSKRFQIWDPSTYESYANKARERAKGLTLKLRSGQGGGA